MPITAGNRKANVSDFFIFKQIVKYFVAGARSNYLKIIASFVTISVY